MRNSARAPTPVRSRSPLATGQLRNGCDAVDATQPPLSRSSQRTSPCTADSRPTNAGNSPATLPARALLAGSQTRQTSSKQQNRPSQRADGPASRKRHEPKGLGSEGQDPAGFKAALQRPPRDGTAL